MKKKEKKLIIIIVIVAIIIWTGILIWKNVSKKDEEPQEQLNQEIEKYVEILEDGTKLNTSNKLKDTKIVDGLEIGNVQLTYQNGIAVMLADVKNTTSQDLGLTVIEITLYDDQKNIIDVIEGLVSPVKVGESVQLNMSVSGDYANAYDFKVVKK